MKERKWKNTRGRGTEPGELYFIYSGDEFNYAKRINREMARRRCVSFCFPNEDVISTFACFSLTTNIDSHSFAFQMFEQTKPRKIRNFFYHTHLKKKIFVYRFLQRKEEIVLEHKFNLKLIKLVFPCFVIYYPVTDIL